MKMVNRALLFIYTLVLMIASFLILILPLDLNILPIEEVVGLIRFLRGNYILSILAGLLLILTFLHLILQLRPTDRVKEGSYLVLRNDYGEVFIYENTIIGLTNRVAENFIGIHNIKVKVSFVEGRVKLSLRGEADHEINIPETSMELQKKLKDHIENTTGAQVSHIKVEIVNTISNNRNR